MAQVINSFEENGTSYYQLYMSCPVCTSRGVSTPQTLWTHYDNNCQGDIYVGDNAYYKCDKCGHSAHVLDWKYNCPSHSSSPDEFVGADAASVASTITVAGQLTDKAGIPWLQRFLENLQRDKVRRGMR